MKITAQWVKEKVTEKAEHWTALLNDIDDKLKDAVERQEIVNNARDINWVFKYKYPVKQKWLSCINTVIDELISRGFTVKVDTDGTNVSITISVTGEWK